MGFLGSRVQRRRFLLQLILGPLAQTPQQINIYWVLILPDGEDTRVWEPPCTYMENLFFFFPPFFFLLVFFKEFLICPISSLVFLNFPDLSHQKIFPWKHGNIEI